MRTAVLLTAAALLAASTGCAFLKRLVGTGETNPPANTGPIQPMTASDLLGYLNRQSDAVTSVRYPRVSIALTAPSPGDPKRTENFTLGSSTLICARPRNFLMVGGKGLTGDLVHIGSNDREFWMHTRPPLDQTYVFCSHTDFAAGRGELPIPFDPDWALQALGMAAYDPNTPAKVETDERRREHLLSFDATTPKGQPIKKVVVFAADETTKSQPQVRRHLILDTTGKTIASAIVKEVRTLSAKTDPMTGPVYVQMPTVVQLDWPQHRFKMELTLNTPTVNEPIPESEARDLFTRPTIRGVNPINLADGNFVPSARGATPGGRR